MYNPEAGFQHGMQDLCRERDYMINYILANNKYRSSVKDVKVIASEEIVGQHCLLLIGMVFKKKVRRKVKLRKKQKLWRLGESEVKEEFVEGFNNKCDGKEDWCGLKRKCRFAYAIINTNGVIT